MAYYQDKVLKKNCSDSSQTYREELVLDNCLVEEFSFVGVEFLRQVSIHRSIIKQLEIYGSWFVGGLNFTNNIVLSFVDYQAGGHNEKEFVLSGNIFCKHFRFFDCHFEEKVIVENNLFVEGTDLLAKENPGFDNIFGKGIDVHHNKGPLDLML